jgi:hypothetical protein
VAGDATQRVDPPGQVVVGTLAQHRHHEVPATDRELSNRAGQIGRAVDLQATIVAILPQALQ